MKHGHTYKWTNSPYPIPIFRPFRSQNATCSGTSVCRPYRLDPRQITSNPYGDERAIVLNDSDFYEGSLRVKSYARPGKLFTASNNIIAGEVGTLKAEIFQKLIDSIVDLLRSGK